MLDFNEADAAPLPDRSAQRDAVRAAVSERGLVIRSVSFGPKGLVAYAEEPA